MVTASTNRAFDWFTFFPSLSRYKVDDSGDVGYVVRCTFRRNFCRLINVLYALLPNADKRNVKLLKGFLACVIPYLILEEDIQSA